MLLPTAVNKKYTVGVASNALPVNNRFHKNPVLEVKREQSNRYGQSSTHSCYAHCARKAKTKQKKRRGNKCYVHLDPEVKAQLNISSN
jgi:hypothetical protein